MTAEIVPATPLSEFEKIYRPHWGVIIVSSIVWGGLLILTLVGTIMDPSELRYMIAAAAAVLVFMYWIRRMSIVVNFEGVIYKWGLWNEARLLWQDIGTVQTTTKLQAFHNPRAPMMTIEYRTILRSNNPSEKDLAIDIRKFGKRDLTEFASLLIQKAPRAAFDDATRAMAHGQMPQHFGRKKRP